MSLSTPPAALIPDHPKSKIVYIDYLKVLLTALVIAHHAFVTYGAPGGWYYSEKTTVMGATMVMTMFVAVNQSFFMGFFFFLSALFIPASYRKKGAVVFIKDRFFRLGIPLLFYSFILAPVMNYLVYYFAGEHYITFVQFLSGYDAWISVGVLWFVVALLLFSLIYVAWKYIAKSAPDIWPMPATKNILRFGVTLGVVSFIVRLGFPVGWELEPVGFQLGHFPQYIAVFMVGIAAAESKWLDQLKADHYKTIKTIALCMIFIGFPMIYAIKIIFDNPLEWFSGGLHGEAAFYAFWEQIAGVCIMVTLLAYGKKRLNTPNVFLSKMSRCAFAVYILHPLVLIVLSLLLRTWAVDPSVKLLLVAPFGIVFSFLLGHIVVKIPGVNQVI
ncbi:acyltransferase [Dyadobacter sp. CY107]|uniref:acyltransferase family protein n=1 Tax=Dyadobacter fanqingshengii TaxID=2906443 RepID=UPI001F31F8AA|nr:acyltransferase [Dyadobacter fanqingshengii]MCF2501843.1 acyltransferase [Dyadobacter fanqingshengii]